MTWVFRIAFRDARRSWGRLTLFVSATSIGIGALVAAGLFRFNIDQAIQTQAKPLLGGDVVIRHRSVFSAEDRAFFESLPFPKINEIELRTVAFFPTANASRLMEVRAVEKGFPFYGEVKTRPTGGLEPLFEKPVAIVDESVLAEFNLQIGDTVQLGRTNFEIARALQLLPSESMASVFSAPKIFIDIKHLSATDLNQAQSLARHHMYFQIERDDDLQKAMALIKAREKENNWQARTVADHRRSLGRRSENAARFLKMAALVSLLLGGIGVASLWTVRAKEKRPFAAILRCLGASSRQIVQIFLVQSLVLAFLGSLLGLGLGLLFQAGLPSLLKKLFEVDVPFVLAWSPLISGFVVGFSVTFLFTWLALLPLMRVSPLAVLREGHDVPLPFWRDQARMSVFAALFALLFLFARLETSRPLLAFFVPGGLAVGYMLVSLLVRFLLMMVRRTIRSSWPYVWRQGLANLFRPHNQTHVFVSTLSIGSALIFSVAFMNESLLRNLSLSVGANEPTIALFDIQPSQRERLRDTLVSLNSPVVEEAAFVSMKIHQIKNELVSDMKETTWVHQREYRSTYRDHLSSRETLVEGAWPPLTSPEAGVVPIAMEKDIMNDLKLSLGAPLVFNVQGVLLNAVVVAVRTVDWFQLRPNFFVVFPSGVLESAPQFSLMLARTASVEATGDLQRRMRLEFPNVSVVDLRMVLETIRRYFGKVSLALQTMAMFVAATGFLILISALIAGRHERAKEATLLHILGASSGTIRAIHLIEYGLIGFFSGLFGLLLAWGGSALVMTRFFEVSFEGGFATPIIGVSVMIMMSTATGLFIGRGRPREASGEI